MPVEILSAPKTAREVTKGLPDEGALAMARLEASGALTGLSFTGGESEQERRLLVAKHVLESSGMHSLRPVLPAVLLLKGKPFVLDDHFPFEPFFRVRMPTRTLLKTGRQVAKSTSLAAQGVLFSNCIPYFSTLYVTPLYEMIRRFSQGYVRPFIETSPIRKQFSGSSTMNSVLQRSFKNHSQMYFSFAFLNAERTRGISCDKTAYDEIQNMDPAFIPIIRETMSASPWKIEQYAGTPLTCENTIEQLWQDSSQAEWVIKCRHAGCGHWNVPSMAYDLVKMIGPYRSDISPDNPGVICGKCAKPLNPRYGRWYHQFKDKRWDFAGYHIPQILMPMHYGNTKAWGALVAKFQGRNNTRVNVFFNEVLGESYDSGSKLVTVADLKAAAVLPWENKVEEAEKHLGRYVFKVLAADWGGGGARGPNGKEMISFTCLAALGMLPDGKIECFWGMRSLTPHDHVREAKLCLGAIRRFGLSHLVHDYSGAGALRETVINQAGFPYDRLVAIMLGRTAGKDILIEHPPDDLNPRFYYYLDKPWSLSLTCHHLKYGMLRFFQYDYKSADDRGLLHDFLSLVEVKTDTRLGGDFFSVIRDPNFPDDFAQAVNLGCVALWKLSGKWPNTAEAAQMPIDPELLRLSNPTNVWAPGTY
jgi:hypothetical protein